jgi:hypothetical protein
MADPLEPLGDREELFESLAKEIEALLLDLEQDPDRLARYVNNPVGFLNTETDLSDRAKAILLESDYSVIQEVMKYRESTAIRWICIWII